MTSGRDGWIDLLRAVSALAVVLYHFNVLPMGLPSGAVAAAWRETWSHGHLGVAVFFVLSGYCIVPGWHRSAGLGEFLRRRAGRIMPPYWCSLLLIVLLAVGFKLATGVNDVAALPRTPGAIAATTLLLTSPLTVVPTLNWVYWTLTCLLAFYLIAGLGLLLPRAGRIATLAAVHAFFCFVDAGFHPEPVGPLFFVRHWPVFGAGLALAGWLLDRRAGWAMLAVSLLHAVWALARWPAETAFLAAGALTVAVLALTRNRALPRWLVPLARLGGFSYSLYLVHVPVGIHGLLRLCPEKFATAWQLILSQLLLLAATVAAARLFFLVGERPFLPRPRALS